jgi:hypothetical protein
MRVDEGGQSPATARPLPTAARRDGAHGWRPATARSLPEAVAQGGEMASPEAAPLPRGVRGRRPAIAQALPAARRDGACDRRPAMARALPTARWSGARLCGACGRRPAALPEAVRRGGKLMPRSAIPQTNPLARCEFATLKARFAHAEAACAWGWGDLRCRQWTRRQVSRAGTALITRIAGVSSDGPVGAGRPSWRAPSGRGAA